ncbi:MAG: formate dehydrogenase accessory sulfurtransferase FdhD [Tissierellales bacterium]|nr:formate dehydrogenase accessory sulfurtransferase FdhD [Tissierellales bacterium]
MKALDRDDFKTKQRVKIIKVNGKNISEEDDFVAVEKPFTIFLNDIEIATLMITPESLYELTVGFLISEGIINTVDEIKDLKIYETTLEARAITYEDKALKQSLLNKRLISSGCGNAPIFYNVIDSIKSKKITTDFTIKDIELLALMEKFNKNSKLFIETGGVHSAALANHTNILYFYEDIGRHNAIDKVLGRADMEKFDYSDKIILTSGRISHEIISKTSKRGIPAVISHSAPTSYSIELAKALNITLVGFVRGKRLNVYTNFDNIIQ